VAVGLVKPRNLARLADRVAANAELCKVPLSEWVAMTRRERRSRLQAARKEQDRG
jgi:hypothetical protein